MVLQVFAAFFRPQGSNKPSTSSETDIETFQDQAELENTSSSKKSVARLGWEISHKITALAMIALVMNTSLSGIEAYERIYGEKKQMKTLYWVWFGIVSAFTVIVSFRSIFVKKEWLNVEVEWYFFSLWHRHTILNGKYINYIQLYQSN